MKKRFLLYLLILALSGNGLSSLGAQTKTEQQVKRLNKAIQQMQLSVREMSAEELDQAIRKHEELLAKYSNNEFAPTVLFQLSELYIKKAQHEYQRKMEAYERAMADYMAGKIGIEPKLPRVDFRQAKMFLQEIVKTYPDVPFIDKVYYRLALCNQEEGNRQKSIEYLQRLVESSPRSNLLPEAYFRLGEHYFDKGDNEKALEYYEKLVSADMWSNPFFDMSLYKMGWAYYRLNRYPEAISAFMYLLKDIDVLERVQTQNLDRTAADLKKEAMAYVAISFAEYGEPQEAFDFLDSFEDKVYDQYKLEILSKLGEVYLSQDRFDEAVATFQYLIDHYPSEPQAPNWAEMIIQTYEKVLDLPKANQARGVLVQKFGPESSWYKTQKDSVARATALKLVKQALYKSAVYHQLQGRENKDAQEYRAAADLYQKYLKYFPEDSLNYKVNYYLAECFYDLGEYSRAAEEYKKVYTAYPENDYMEEAAYNCILSYYKAAEQAGDTDPQKFTLSEFYGLIGTTSLEVGNPAMKEFILASNDFVRRYPNSPRTVEILMKEAEVLNSLSRYDLSRRIYLKVVKDFPHSDQFGRAAIMIAQSYFDEEDFEQAEKWYGTIVATLPDTSEEVKKAKIMMASSHYKLAEKRKQMGDLRGAAVAFAEAAMKYPTSQIAELALVEASQAYEALGNLELAASILEKFVEKYPNSRLAEMCILRSAKYREDLGQYDRAAQDYLRLKNLDSPNKTDGIFLAAQNYFKAEKWKQAIEAFRTYLQQANDLNHAIEAQCKIGLALYKLDRDQEAKRAFQNTVKIFEDAPNRQELNTYYVAEAQFMLGEIDYIRFAAIDLTPPLKKNLNRKTQILRSVLKNYTAAAKYRVAEWTTAASYRIGKVFEEFANAILTSPIPENLTQEEALAYEMQLRKLAFPFQKKALDAYQANVKLAEKNGIQNRWVTLSKSHLAMLSSIVRSQSKQEF